MVSATAGRIVASVALANGALAIANQPDTARQVDARVDPGAAAITAGTLTVTYAANDGTAAQVDVLSLVAFRRRRSPRRQLPHPRRQARLPTDHGAHR
jgi:hypothetical protein